MNDDNQVHTDIDTAQTKLGELSEKMFSLKEVNRELDKEWQANKVLIRDLQRQILDIMEEEEIESCSTESGSLRRKVEVYANIQDWDSFYEYVKKTGATELLKKGVLSPPVRAMMEKDGICPPGIGTFLKESLLARIKPTFRQKLTEE